MSENKSGPVKPPVIDLSARESESTAKPETGKTSAGETNQTSASSNREEPSPRIEREAGSTGPLALAVIGGGLLGFIAAYGLASAGYWPTPPADPRLAEIGQLRQALANVPELQARVDEAGSRLDTVGERVAAIETALEETRTAATQDTGPAGAENSDLAEQIVALEARVEELAATSQQPAGGDTSELSGALDALAADVGALQAALSAQEAEIAGLSETVSATRQTIAAQPTDIGAAVQLPLILSGLETAFATGRPYLSELDALRRTAPQIDVPQTLLDAAGTGLPRENTVASTMEAVLPAMLAGGPRDPDAGWQDATLDWFRTTLALRPAGEGAGDSPQALVTRLEAAIARRDFVAADELLSQMPESMRSAAGDLPAMVALHADAARLIEAARRQALTVATEAAP